ncbi:MAG: hypothetical protein PHO41_05795, partial [Eubacteriales bacterium]|nr:hypothetical protein [Eubacteriales bacterium]
FKVLIKELQSLALDIKVLSDTHEVIEIGESVDEDEPSVLDVNIAGTEDAPVAPPPAADFSEFDDDFSDFDSDEEEEGDTLIDLDEDLAHDLDALDSAIEAEIEAATAEKDNTDE